MGRLFLILVKKFGYAAARKMAPKYGISENVVNKVMKDVGRGQMQRSGTLSHLDMDPNRGRVLREMGQGQMREMGAPAQLAEYQRTILPLIREQAGREAVSTGNKNIDRIIKSLKRHRRKPAQTFAERKAGRRLEEPLYYKRQRRNMDRLMESDYRTRRVESPDERLERLINEFYDKGVDI